MSAVETVEAEVRELIRRSGLDPARDTAAVRTLVRDAVTDYDERSLHGGLPILHNLDDAIRDVMDTVAGYGPLQRYFDDPQIEEIWVNGPSRVVDCLFDSRAQTHLATPRLVFPDARLTAGGAAG